MNNIYELLNDAQINLEEYEEQNLSDYEIHKTKKKVLKEINRMNKKKLKWKTAVATACLCLVLGLGTVSVVAGLLPIPESIKNVFGIKSTEQVESAEKMGTAINISSVDKGYKITATGVLRDSRHVCVTYRVEKADGSTLDKKGRKCTNVDFWNFDSNDSWMGAEVDIVNQEYSPYYIDYYTIWNYIGEVDKKVEVSLGELRLWFDNEEYESIEVDGKWKFEIPTDIEDSSIDIAKGQTIKFGKNKGTLDELRISPIGYSISVTSDEEVHDNEMIKGIDGQIWLYLKNGEKIQCGGPSGPIDNGDGTWSFREIGTFENLIPLSSMDKVVFEDYEISIEKVSTEQHLDTQLTNESWQCADLNDKFENNSNDITVSAKDIYDALGYGWVECQKTGYYRFEATGNVYDINSPHPKDSLIWQVYILDEPFTDIPNGIPSVKKHIKLEEQQYIEKGQYIVFYCSQNVKSYGAETVGDDSAFLECHFLDEN